MLLNAFFLLPLTAPRATTEEEAEEDDEEGRVAVVCFEGCGFCFCLFVVGMVVLGVGLGVLSGGEDFVSLLVCTLLLLLLVLLTFLGCCG